MSHRIEIRGQGTPGETDFSFFFFFSILARDFGGLDLGDGGSEINF